MRSTALATRLVLALALGGCASSVDPTGSANEPRLLAPSIRLGLPAGWNPNSIVVDDAGYHSDVQAGMAPPEAWKKNFIRSDQRGFFISSEEWNRIVSQATPLSQAASSTRASAEPQIRLRIRRQPDPSLLRVEFELDASTAHEAHVALVGASDGKPRDASIQYSIRSGANAAAVAANVAGPVIRRDAGAPFVDVAVVGDSGGDPRRAWVVTQLPDGNFVVNAAEWSPRR